MAVITAPERLFPRKANYAIFPIDREAPTVVVELGIVLPSYKRAACTNRL